MTDTGTFRRYIDKTFSDEHMKVIRAASVILDSFESQGHMLSLRQLYYQFVARGWMENKLSSYNRLGNIISDARMAGLISWTSIEDRNRGLMGLRTFDSPAQAVRSVAREYRIDMWANQPFRPEVWVEKAALEGVITGICNKHRVDFFSCRGYNSQSEQWRAGQRFANYVCKGQRPIVFHLGDHDPSGIDMTRDNRDRLSMFAGVPVMVQRLALNMNQIEQYNPPPNPAKMTDSRYAGYQQQFGDESWELDALNPNVISDLIGDALSRVKDEVKWDEMLRQETDDRQVLDDICQGLGGSVG